MDVIDAYYIKCKSKVVIKDPEEVKMQNGRPAISGKCPQCGTKVFRIKSKTDNNPSYKYSNKKL